jgi:hypothetical protein
MTQPEVIRCADGHYRKAVYGIGPYIADYPEQVLLAGIVGGWCVRLAIHSHLSALAHMLGLAAQDIEQISMRKVHSLVRRS